MAPARVVYQYGWEEPVEGLSFAIRQVQRFLNLPPPAYHHWYIVSAMVWEAAEDRTDLLCPEFMLRERGYLYGCSAFRMKGKDVTGIVRHNNHHKEDAGYEQHQGY